jgi:hypothetical protein
MDTDRATTYWLNNLLVAVRRDILPKAIAIDWLLAKHQVSICRTSKITMNSGSSFDPTARFKNPPSFKLPTGHLSTGVCERLIEMIRRFEEQVDADHDVGARLATFGTSVSMHIQRISCYNPTLICFHGVLEGSGDYCELIQNVNQVAILLVRVKRIDPSQPKQKIGFDIEA